MAGTASNLDRARSAPRRGLAPGAPLGRIAGVEVRLHWTWWLVAALITVALAGSVFPDEVPGLSNGTYAVMGLATAVLFFASLLLHELGHALAARRDGIPTRGITLWMLGGVARSGAPFPSAGVEARVALAGPAVSAVLGAGFVAAGLIAGLPDAVAAVLEWLGWTNLLLLAFNMIPAMPLDGGRLLHAVLWHISGSLLKATRVASRVSQVLAVLLIAAGLAWFLVGAFGGLWVAFIGWFTFSAAAAERAATEARIALAGVQVADAMTSDPITVPPSATADELLEMRRRTGHSVYPVVDEHGDAIGLTSVGSAQLVPERRRQWVTVRELLAQGPAPLAVDADAELTSVVPALVEDRLHRAAVLRAGRLVGLLSLTDVSRTVRLRSAAGS
jgi:Zn-dependent protease/predicted transcriptional regulator